MPAIARIVAVTGTGTGVGKTVVSACLCASAPGPVVYLKAAQTGVPGDVPDVDTVARLAGAGVTLVEGARYPDPMSPEAAARVSGLAPARLDDIAARASELARGHASVVLEGAGGLLVRYGPDGWTLADLAARLGAPVVLVTGPELGTLNSTALTLEAMAARGLPLAGVVVTPWPDQPTRLHEENLRDLATLAGGDCVTLGDVPDEAGARAASLWSRLDG